MFNEFVYSMNYLVCSMNYLICSMNYLICSNFDACRFYFCVTIFLCLLLFIIGLQSVLIHIYYYHHETAEQHGVFSVEEVCLLRY